MPSDDARLPREVKEAQTRYERTRRALLPREWASPSHQCDAYIGRFCYWYDSTETPPKAEAAGIVQARDRLLGFLDSAVALHPTAAWLVGQRTRYLIEAKRFDEAIEASRSCRAEPWWCAALGGLALHAASNFRAADSAFALALDRSSAAERCAWFDLRTIVSPSMSAAFRRARCVDREALAAEAWALSKPLWMIEGNDLRTEHFARLTMAAIFARTANTYGSAWGSDIREMMVRYGWDEWFTRDETNDFLLTGDAVRVTGHGREPSYAFFPDVRFPITGQMMRAGVWDLRNPMAKSRYAPRYLERLTALPHQLARFPRRDSTLLVAAIGPSDTAMQRDSLVAFLGVLRDTIVIGTKGRAPLHVVVPHDAQVVSVEAIGERSRHAARARYGVGALERKNGWVLSDLLLYVGNQGAPVRDLDSALAHAITGPVSRDTPIGVLWMIDAPQDAPIAISVAVTPVHASLARRIAARLHLAANLSPVRMQWNTATSGHDAIDSVVLRLPAKARGDYRVVLTVVQRDGVTLSASRDLAIQ